MRMVLLALKTCGKRSTSLAPLQNVMGKALRVDCNRNQAQNHILLLYPMPTNYETCTVDNTLQTHQTTDTRDE